MSSAILHIVNGYSAAGSLAHALGRGHTILVQTDVLSCGPMPRVDSVEEWREVRERYWRQKLQYFSPDKRDLLWNTDALRAAQSLCFWMGSGLSDQLLLSSSVHLLRLLGVEARDLSSIQFSLEIFGLGMLSPQRLKDHPPTEILNAAGIAEAEKVWMAVTAPEPDELLAHLKEESFALPALHRALRVLLERYPEERAGLNYIDWDLLKHSQIHGPRATRVIGYTMESNADHLDPVGDMYLVDRMERLADPSLMHPALELTGDIRSLRDCEVRITDVGKAILAGTRNFVELNGIDDWVGGVHLDSKAGRVWFRRENELVRSG